MYRLGRLVVVVEQVTGVGERTGQVVVYARVWSAGQRAVLDRQVARVATWVTGQRLAVSGVVTEIGSTLGGHCKKFLALLRDRCVSSIVVEHRDRFARLGATGLDAAG